jgi:hypothetical protein
VAGVVRGARTRLSAARDRVLGALGVAAGTLREGHVRQVLRRPDVRPVLLIMAVGADLLMIDIRAAQ